MRQPKPAERTPLTNAIAIGAVMDHLKALNVIADQNNGTRALNTTGYSASVQYIVSQLQQNTDYEVCMCTITSHWWALQSMRST